MVKKKKRMPRSRKGMMPGQFKRGPTPIEVERTLRESDISEDEKYDLHHAEMTTIDTYVLRTERLDEKWMYTITLGGQTWRIPGRVADRMFSHKQSITSESLSMAGVRRSEKLRTKAEEDQIAAEREADLKGR
jgi:hypothetical protein